MIRDTIYDIAIIGGGIVGNSTLFSILSKRNLKIVLIEAEKSLAAHQTGNNSGVIHSGLYYKPGSLKAKNCTVGREMLYSFCDENNISYERCGKVVTAVNKEELPVLEMLYERGKENGLIGIKRLTKDELKNHEPNANGIAGLFVPQTGIVNYKKVTETLAHLSKEKNAEIITYCKLNRLVVEDDMLTLLTPRGEIKTKFLINCAGLHSDNVAKMCGVDPGIKIIPFRGEYYKLKKEKEYLVKNLIYPVPDPKFPFLGVHFTRMIEGGIEAGPNAVLAFKKEGYKKTDFSTIDIFDILTFPGFWKMVSKNYKMGLAEMRRSFSKNLFVRSLKKLVPDLEADDIIPAGAGVRAQALSPSGKLLDDFRIVEAERMVHVVNAPSPAATASLSIGNTIANLVLKKYDSEGLN